MVGAVLTAFFALGAMDLQGGDRRNPVPKPNGYDEFLTFVADGEWNPAVPPSGGPKNCNFIFCDGTYFHEKVMRFSPDQIAALEAEAKAYFKDEFGVDVDDPANTGRVDFGMLEIDPRWNYRVRAWSNHWVPKKGWEVRDGAFFAMIIDPNGFELGGNFAGVLANPGDMLFMGHYNIKYKRTPWGRWREKIIKYRSTTPMLTEPRFGLVTIDCQLSRDGFQEDRGAAQGLGGPLIPAPNGTLKMNARNVLLFPR
jgi:hypothetical protein